MTGYTKPIGPGNWDGVIYGFNQEGNLIFRNEFGGSRADQPYTITEFSPDEFMLTGVTYGIGSDSGDVWLLKLNAAGEVLEED